MTNGATQPAPTQAELTVVEGQDVGPRLGMMGRALERITFNANSFSPKARGIVRDLQEFHIKIHLIELDLSKDELSALFANTIIDAPAKLQFFSSLYRETNKDTDNNLPAGTLVTTLPQTALSWKFDSKRLDLLLKVINTAYDGIKSGAADATEKTEFIKGEYNYFLKYGFIATIDIEFNQEAKHRDQIAGLKKDLREKRLAVMGSTPVRLCHKMRSEIREEMTDLRSRIAAVDRRLNKLAKKAGTNLPAEIKADEKKLEVIKARLDVAKLSERAGNSNMSEKIAGHEKEYTALQLSIAEKRLRILEGTDEPKEKKVRETKSKLEKALEEERDLYESVGERYRTFINGYLEERKIVIKEIKNLNSEIELLYDVLAQAAEDKQFQAKFYNEFYKKSRSAYQTIYHRLADFSRRALYEGQKKENEELKERAKTFFNE